MACIVADIELVAAAQIEDTAKAFARRRTLCHVDVGFMAANWVPSNFAFGSIARRG